MMSLNADLLQCNAITCEVISFFLLSYMVHLVRRRDFMAEGLPRWNKIWCHTILLLDNWAHQQSHFLIQHSVSPIACRIVQVFNFYCCDFTLACDIVWHKPSLSYCIFKHRLLYLLYSEVMIQYNIIICTCALQRSWEFLIDVVMHGILSMCKLYRG